MRILVISCSLNPASRSALLAERARDALRSADPTAEVRVLDLRENQLPMCDGHSAYADPAVARMADHIRDADAALLAVPVYNYYANAAAKNLIELTGAAWNDKLVGFLCTAGGHGSYMSVLALANSLMLDFRCLVVPRFVFTTTGDDDTHPVTPDIRRRIDELAAEVTRLGSALAAAPAQRG